MTKEEKIQAYAMRLDGCTYQEIANKFGVTKQCIQQNIGVIGATRDNECRVLRLSKNCIYDGLAKFIKENEVNSAVLADVIGVCKASAHQRIVGERNFNISDIYKILNYTGMTFEECFALKRKRGWKE